jgi:hypothetical protein
MSSDDSGGRLNPPNRIEIPNDILILDNEFCRMVLGGATRRTAARLEAQGLPFVMVAGRKYRPLNEGREWLAGRIRRRDRAQRNHNCGA